VLSVWDTPQDPSAGRIATGIIAAPGQVEHWDSIEGQAIMIFMSIRVSHSRTMPGQGGPSLTCLTSRRGIPISTQCCIS